jgi:preprotein translocase subunit SecG
MEILFLIIVILSASLIVLFIMMQDEQGEGVGGMFGGGSNTAFGSRSGNVLTKITTILAVIFFAGTLVLALINRTPKEDSTLDKALQTQKGGQASTWFVQTATKSTDKVSDDKSLLLDMSQLESKDSAVTPAPEATAAPTQPAP